jgi:hypothetical protein
MAFPTSGLVAYYKFDADNSVDSVNAYNGTDTAMAYGASYGKINNGALFNGSSSKIAIPSGVYSLFNGTSAWTVNGWLKQVSVTGERTFFSTGLSSGSPAYKYETQLKADAALYILRRKGDIFVNQVSGGTTLTTGVWYMVTFVYNGSTISVYLNATSDATPVASTGTCDTYDSGALGVTIQEAAKFLSADMDEVGFWSRALAGTEITDLYNSGAGLQYSPPAALVGANALLDLI